MPRTPIVTRDQVPEPLRAAFDAETASSGGVVASGPGSVMINSPEMRRRANYLVNYLRDESTLPKKIHTPPDLVVRDVAAHRKPPDVRIWRLRNQSRVGTVPPSTSTPHWPACLARR
jgi:hypothetical protein